MRLQERAYIAVIMCKGFHISGTKVKGFSCVCGFFFCCLFFKALVKLSSISSYILVNNAESILVCVQALRKAVKDPSVS